MASKSKGRMCVVAGCNNRPSDTVSIHVFPKDERQRAAWTRFVGLTRADWTGPSQYTVVCIAHFTDRCFEAQFSLMREFVIPAKKRLCPGAILSLYPKRKVDDLNLALLSSPEPKPKRQAAAKLKKNRLNHLHCAVNFSILIKKRCYILDRGSVRRIETSV
ncbi:THAP domain-containing protein 10-like [Ostrea edulis]|uniref:THAP domain-containing protein 10-like n=1 Tax=Ostrea edulis TaxID=37623 RepID=UPI0024AEF811|nr:THAP domain-containing protein 10-like [Ostrea edulis]